MSYKSVQFLKPKRPWSRFGPNLKPSRDLLVPAEVSDHIPAIAGTRDSSKGAQDSSKGKVNQISAKLPVDRRFGKGTSRRFGKGSYDHRS